MSRKLFVSLLVVFLLGLFPAGTGNATVKPAGVPGCPPAKERTYENSRDVTITGPAIVWPWWNNGVPPFGQTQVKVKVRSATVTFLDMLGKSWKYQDNSACRRNLNEEFNNSSLPKRTLTSLENEGLVIVR